MFSKKLQALLGGIALSIALSSCAITYTTPLVQEANEGIEIYTTQLPQKPYEEIAHVQVWGDIMTTPKLLLKLIKKEAKKKQADAVVKVTYTRNNATLYADAVLIRYQ